MLENSSKNLTNIVENEKIIIGSVFPMYLENVEYSVIYKSDLAVDAWKGKRWERYGIKNV